MTHFDAHELENQEPSAYWDQRYAPKQTRTRGTAGRFLQQHLQELSPGRVLELGCGTGDDSLWLAEQGWQVTAVDISEIATQTAQRLAEEAGLADKIHFLACDLASEFPAGQFDLVCALYFQSLFTDFPRIEILQTAASRVVSEGHLLIVTHATGLPWAEHQLPEHEFPSAEGDWQALALPETEWQMKNLSVQKRLAKGPQDQQAEVKDNLIWARRL